jgi:hypothetical protein
MAGSGPFAAELDVFEQHRKDVSSAIVAIPDGSISACHPGQWRVAVEVLRLLTRL